MANNDIIDPLSQRAPAGNGIIDPLKDRRQIPPVTGFEAEHPLETSLGRGALADIIRNLKGAQRLAKPLLRPLEPTIRQLPLAPQAEALERRVEQLPFVKDPTMLEKKAQSQTAAKIGEFLPALLPFTAAEGLGARLAIPAAVGATEVAGAPGTTPAEIGLGAGTGLALGGAAAGAAKAPSLLRFVGKKEAAPFLRANVQDRVNNILKTLKGDSTRGTIHHDVFSNMSQFFKELEGGHPESEEAHYINPENSYVASLKRFENLSDQMGEDFKYNPTSYHTAIEDETNKLQIDLNKMADQQSPQARLLKKHIRILNGTESKITNPTDIEIAKRNINRVIGNAIHTPEDRVLIKPLSNIKEGLRESLRDSAIGNPALKEALQASDKQYANEIIPFKKIAGTKRPTKFWDLFSKGKGTPEGILNDAIRSGQDTKLEQFMKLVPDQSTRNKLGYWWLKEAEEKPEKLIPQYLKLSPRQRTLLFPAPIKNQLEELANLRRSAPGAFSTAGTSGVFKRLGSAASATLLGHPGIGAALLSSPEAIELASDGRLPPALTKRIENLILGRRGVPSLTRRIGRQIAGRLTPATAALAGREIGGGL